MITRFQVKNYKLLKDVDVPLTPIHVIVGQNDSGKTALLEAILAFCRTAEPGRSLAQAFEGDWQGRELVYFGQRTSTINFTASIEGFFDREKFSRRYEMSLKFHARPNRHCTVVRETVNNIYSLDSAKKPTQTVLSRRGGLKSDQSAEAGLDQIASALLPAALYRFDARTMALPAAFDPNRQYRMDSDGFGLATLLDDILGYDAQQFLNLSAEFCSYFPEFRRVRIETSEALSRVYDQYGRHRMGGAVGKSIVFESTEGERIQSQRASDGAILFLGFLALLYTPSPPRILLIEEPERGVYPKRLAEIIEILRRLLSPADGRTPPQVVMTTHSPYVLSFFQPEEVTLMSRRGDHAIARPLRNAPHIHERMGEGGFYLGELWYNLEEAELFGDAEVAGVD